MGIVGTEEEHVLGTEGEHVLCTEVEHVLGSLAGDVDLNSTRIPAW